MPGHISENHMGGRIDTPGNYDLMVLRVVQGSDAESNYIAVTWGTPDGETFVDRVRTEGRFGWCLRRLLKAFNLPCKKGDAWNEEEWVGKRAILELFRNDKYINCRAYSAVGGAAPEPETEAPDAPPF